MSADKQSDVFHLYFFILCIAKHYVPISNSCQTFYFLGLKPGLNAPTPFRNPYDVVPEKDATKNIHGTDGRRDGQMNRRMDREK